MLDNNVITGVLDFIACDIHNLVESGEYDFATELLNNIADLYLINHMDINYNSEYILEEDYVNYSKILLASDKVSKKNKDKMQDYVDEICSLW